MQRAFWEFDGQIMKENGWVQTGSSGASWDQMFLRYVHSNIHCILLKLFFITIFWLCLSFDFNIYLCSLFYPSTLYWNVNSYFLTIFTDPSFFWISTRLIMCGILIYRTHNLVIYFQNSHFHHHCHLIDSCSRMESCRFIIWTQWRYHSGSCRCYCLTRSCHKVNDLPTN